jgi:hypothetical protein
MQRPGTSIGAGPTRTRRGGADPSTAPGRTWARARPPQLQLHPRLQSLLPRRRYHKIRQLSPGPPSATLNRGSGRSEAQLLVESMDISADLARWLGGSRDSTVKSPQCQFRLGSESDGAEYGSTRADAGLIQAV